MFTNVLCPPGQPLAGADLPASVKQHFTGQRYEHACSDAALTLVLVLTTAIGGHVEVTWNGSARVPGLNDVAWCWDGAYDITCRVRDGRWERSVGVADGDLRKVMFELEQVLACDIIPSAEQAC